MQPGAWRRGCACLALPGGARVGLEAEAAGPESTRGSPCLGAWVQLSSRTCAPGRRLPWPSPEHSLVLPGPPSWRCLPPLRPGWLCPALHALQRRERPCRRLLHSAVPNDHHTTALSHSSPPRPLDLSQSSVCPSFLPPDRDRDHDHPARSPQPASKSERAIQAVHPPCISSHLGLIWQQPPGRVSLSLLTPCFRPSRACYPPITAHHPSRSPSHTHTHSHNSQHTRTQHSSLFPLTHVARACLATRSPPLRADAARLLLPPRASRLRPSPRPVQTRPRDRSTRTRLHA